MSNNKVEKHLDVYENRYELHQDNGTTVYYQGFQNKAAQQRYTLINQELQKGYLDKMIALSSDKTALMLLLLKNNTLNQ